MQLVLKKSVFVLAIAVLQFSSLASQEKEKQYNRRIMAQRAPEHERDADLWSNLGFLRKLCPSYAVAPEWVGNLKDKYSCSSLDEMLKTARYGLLWQEKAKIEKKAYERVVKNIADDEEYKYAATYRASNPYLIGSACNDCKFTYELERALSETGMIVGRILDESAPDEDRNLAKILIWKRIHELARIGREEAKALGMDVNKH